jgi:hypothetical protein
MTNGDNGNEIGARYGKFGLLLRGQNSLVVFILLVFAGLIVWTNSRFLDSVTAADSMRRDEHRQIADTMDTLSWLMSLPQDRRPELTPPASVWKRLKSQTFDELERERSYSSKGKKTE